MDLPTTVDAFSKITVNMMICLGVSITYSSSVNLNLHIHVHTINNTKAIYQLLEYRVLNLHQVQD